MSTWLVWCPDLGETEAADSREIEANSPMAAAEELAREMDSWGDYDIVRGTDAIVFVRLTSDEVAKYVVSGESVPLYIAKRLT
jgi:hypothetical protein